VGLQAVEFILDLEKALGISIPDRDVPSWGTSRGLVTYLLSRGRSPTAAMVLMASFTLGAHSMWLFSRIGPWRGLGLKFLDGRGHGPTDSGYQDSEEVDPTPAVFWPSHWLGACFL
jgi:hypothetical protein